MSKIKTALISVSNKKNLKSILTVLKKNNVKIISSGGTYKEIKRLKFDCLEISKFTNSSEILNGRVKTLHPKIYTSILHDRNKEDHYQTFKKIKFPKIDYIIVNLYPFEKFSSKNKNDLTSIEMIDIGGVSLLRAGSKNFHSITSISSPKAEILVQYEFINKQTLEEWLSQLKQKKVKILNPKRSNKLKTIKMVQKNAHLELNRILNGIQDNESAIEDLSQDRKSVV